MTRTGTWGMDGVSVAHTPVASSANSGGPDPSLRDKLRYRRRSCDPLCFDILNAYDLSAIFSKDIGSHVGCIDLVTVDMSRRPSALLLNDSKYLEYLEFRPRQKLEFERDYSWGSA
jgi:hypothetical protein